MKPVTCTHCGKPFTPTTVQTDTVERYSKNEPPVRVTHTNCPHCGKRVILSRKQP